MQTKRILSLLLAGAMIFALCACGGEAATQTPDAQPAEEAKTAAPAAAEYKKVINLGTNNAIVGLDPLNTNSNIARAVNVCVFDTLVESDHAGTITPCLATSWEVDESGCTWTMHLREGVKFNNGEDFTSDDVVVTFQRILDEGSALAIKSQFWRNLASVEAIDDYTVAISTSEPFYAFLSSCAFTTIMAGDAFRELGEAYWNDQHMYGTGPWVFDEWVDGAYTHLVKNENYWNKENYDCKADELYIRFLTEVPTAIASHISGDLDAYLANGGINPELAALYDPYKDSIEIRRIDSCQFMYLGLRCADGVFADQNARLALDYAIDRQLICDTIYSGFATVGNSVVLPMLAGYDASLPNYEYNPELAKEYLAKSNYDGHQISLYVPTSVSAGKDQALAISEMLNEVGFNVNVEAVELAVLTDLRKSGDYEFFLVNDTALGGELAKYMSMNILGNTHKHGFENEEMMTLVSNILGEMDADKRAELYSQYANLAREVAAPHSILYYLTQLEAINYSLKNVEYYADGVPGFKYIDWA